MLYESAVGYGLFEVTEFDEIGQAVDKVQEAVRCDAPRAHSSPR